MKNKIFILMVFTLMTVLTEAHSRGSPVPQPTPPSPIEESIETEVAKGVQFFPIRNYTNEEKEVLIVAEQLANNLLQSQCFSNFMVQRGLIETGGRTSIQVVEFLKNTNLTVPVQMYSAWWSNVIGYRDPPKPDVYTNRKYHAGATACSRSSNLTHEWSHTAGFTHSFKDSPVRPYSVPYSINAAFSACCFCVPHTIKNCSIK